jgi:hypothetical protein
MNEFILHMVTEMINDNINEFVKKDLIAFCSTKSQITVNFFCFPNMGWENIARPGENLTCLGKIAGF